MRSELVAKLLKETPLEIRVKNAVLAHFAAANGGRFFMSLDQDGNTLPEEEEQNRKCYELAKPLIEELMSNIKEWRLDGCPE